MTKVPKAIQDDPVAILAYVIGHEPCPDGKDFQVCDEDGNQYSIYECITPDGDTVDVGERAMLEAAHWGVKALEEHGFKIVRA
jgi:hypothetical protein